MNLRIDSMVSIKQGASRRTPPEKVYLHGFVPVIMEFTGWVLGEAVRTGKKRLYFLSRDGYQMYLAACRLTQLRKLPLECRYLHVSRYAMRAPAYHLDVRRGLNRICSGGMEVTLERILKRGALTDAETLEITKLLGREETCQERLNRRQIAELKERLGREPLFLKYVKAHSREAYADTMGYLQQEGLLSDVPYAIVDSGWVGTSQQTLQILLQSRKPEIRVEGYYFGLYEIPPDADSRDYHGWYFTPGTGLKRKVLFSNSLFEAVCSADEGMTIGYREKDGRYLPRLDPAGNPNGEMLRRNLETLRRFLETYDSAPDDISGRRGYVRGGHKAFTALMARPSAREAAYFGSLLFSDDMLAGNCREVAARLTEEEIGNLYLLPRLGILSGRRKGVLRESAWPEGSIVRLKRSGRSCRKDLRHIRWYKYLVYGRKQMKARMRTVRERQRGLIRERR